MKKWYRIQNYIYQTVLGKDKISKMIDVDKTSIWDWEALVWNAVTKKREWKSIWLIWLSSYNSATFTVSAWTTDYNVKTNQSALWNWITSAKYIRITSTANVWLKLNATTATSYPMTTSESPLEIFYDSLTNLYITTAGSPANITILLMA